jgi:hypothetical protein
MLLDHSIGQKRKLLNCEEPRTSEARFGATWQSRLMRRILRPFDSIIKTAFNIGSLLDGATWQSRLGLNRPETNLLSVDAIATGCGPDKSGLNAALATSSLISVPLRTK